MTRDLILQGITAGVFATLVMDLAFVLGKVTGFIRPPYPLPLGRWVSHALRGRLRHHTILDTPRIPGEGPLTLVSHYAIGATLGIAFLLALPPGSAGSPFVGGVVFGTGTSLLPWLIMFPAMGFGFFGVKGPAGAHMLRTSLYTHVAFGLGLGVWAVWIRGLL